MIDQVSLPVAFGAGLLSFLSPCVLPMVPVYIGTICGTGVYTAKSAGIRLPLFMHSFSFVLGFSVVFVALGVIAGLTGLSIDPVILNRIAGGLLIASGVFILAALKLPWLNYEKRLAPNISKTTGFFRSFFIGIAFSLGWTACVGPILAGILAVAAVKATAWHGAYLLAVYSLGLGLPFLIIGVAFDSMLPLIKRINRYSQIIHILSGLLLISIGVLILTDNIGWISSIVA